MNLLTIKDELEKMLSGGVQSVQRGAQSVRDRILQAAPQAVQRISTLPQQVQSISRALPDVGPNSFAYKPMQSFGRFQQQFAEPFLRSYSFGQSSKLPGIGSNFHPETQIGKNLGLNLPTLSAALGVGASTLIGSKGTGAVLSRLAPITAPAIGGISRVSPMAGAISKGALTAGVGGGVFSAITPRSDSLKGYAKDIRNDALIGTALGGVLGGVGKKISDLSKVSAVKGSNRITPKIRLSNNPTQFIGRSELDSKNIAAGRGTIVVNGKTYLRNKFDSSVFNIDDALSGQGGYVKLGSKSSQSGRIAKAGSRKLTGGIPGQAPTPKESQPIGQLQSQSKTQILPEKGIKESVSSIRGILTQPDSISQKERGFISHIKIAANTPKQVKKLVSGTYIPRTNQQLKQDALNLIRKNPKAAEEIAKNPRNDVDVQVGNELLNYYGSKGNFKKAQQVAEGMAESGTEFGRAVQAFSQYDKTTPQGAIRFAQSKINEYNKLNPNKKLNVSDKQIKDIFDAAHKIQQMSEGKARNIASHQLMEKVNNLIPSSVADKAITVWKAGLLTSLRTHERNLIGNTVHQGAEITKDYAAAPFDALMSLRTGQRSMTATTQGIGTGAKKGLVASKDVLQTGFDPEEAINKYDVRHITWGNNPIEQGLKKYTDIVFRTLGAADKPFWNASFARSLHDQAGAAAINAGKGGDAKFIQNLVKKPTEKMLIAATKDANVATFKNETVLGNVITQAKQQLNKNVVTKIFGEGVAPFTGVPSSIAGQIFNYSPLGLAKGTYNAGRVMTQNLPELQRQAAQELGRGVVGTGIFGLGAYLASRGLMTGQPKDTEEAKQWELEGKKPNSIFIGGQWRSINSVGPEAIVILAGAKAQEESQKGDEASLGRYGANLGKDYLGQTFLAGVQGPINAITDPERYGQSYLRSQAGSFIPNFIKDIAKSQDSSQRQTNSVTDSLKYGTPGLRNTLLPKQDVMGDTLPNEQTGLAAFTDLFNSTTPRSSVVTDELKRLNDAGHSATPSKLQKSQTIKGEKMSLTPEQLVTLNSVTGQQAKVALTELFQSSDYQGLSDELKSKAASDLLSDIRKGVRGTIDLSQPPKASDFPAASIVRPDQIGLPNTATQSTPTQGGQLQFTLVSDTGTVKRIDLSKEIEFPTLTGSAELDKKLISDYKGDITKRKNDIVELYKAGKLTAVEAENLIGELTTKSNTSLAKSGNGKKGRAPKKISVRYQKVKPIKLSSAKGGSYKPAKLKISKVKLPKRRVIKIKV